MKAIEQGLAIEAIEADVTTFNTGTLILESDMPGGPNSVAGPPPPGTKFDAPPLPSLIHDDTWFSAVRGAGYHEHLLDNLDRAVRRRTRCCRERRAARAELGGGRCRGAADAIR